MQVSGATRGLCVCGTDIYAVIGNGVYRISSLWKALHISDANIPGTGYCKMIFDGTYLSICNGSGLYVVEVASGAFTNVRQASWIAYQDTYMLAVNQNSKTFSCSAINNPTSWNAADYGLKIGRQDKLLTIATMNRVVYLFGHASTELWIDVGAADFPFRRTDPGLVEIGCGAIKSPAECNESIYFIDNNRRVCGMIGSSWQPVSTPEINRIFSRYSTVEDAEGYSFIMDGHAMYMITFPTEDKTWVYDTTTTSWFKWGSKRSRTFDHMFLGISPVTFNGMILFGNRYDATSIRLLHLNPDEYSDAGDQIQRQRTLPAISADGKRFYFTRFELDAEVGHSPAGVDPTQILLDYSDDHGHTWSSRRPANMGSLGSFRTRVNWYGLGSSYERMFRVTMTDDALTKIYGASLDGEPGAH